jgi:hypothetical protein
LSVGNPSPLRGEIEKRNPFPRVSLRFTRGYIPAPRWGEFLRKKFGKKANED